MKREITMNKMKLYIIFVCFLCVFLALDIGYARREMISESLWLPESTFDGLIKQTTSKVSIVRSDDPALPNPTAISDANLTYAQIEEMVRRSVELVGGFSGRIKAGDQVLIKPNIVSKEASGIGETTDVRVVKAVVRLVNEIAPGEVEIIVGEGSAVATKEFQDYGESNPWDEMWDVNGYQSLLSDPDLAGMNFRMLDLNGPCEDLVNVTVPGGGYSPSTVNGVWVHRLVLEADYNIDVPVMKVSRRGLTVALKNHIGYYPGNIYGYAKGKGVPQDDYANKIHVATKPSSCVNEDVIDMVLIAGTDFTVIDAIMCMEKSKAAIWKNNEVTNNVRRNMIIASSDLVAADHVCSRLMGMNPDDMDQITLAEKLGIGVNDPQRIEVLGSTIEASSKPFIKANGNHGDFGQSNRTWLLRGIFNADGISDPIIDHEFISGEAALVPTAGMDGWSEPIYFFDDRITLGGYFGGPGGKIVAYAFTYFNTPKDQLAELWLGHDEALRVYLNGEIVYDYHTIRRFNTGDLVNVKVSVPIKQGENTLLVKVFHEDNYFDFCLNICEPETNPDYDGNRVWGLKFRALPDQPTRVENQRRSSWENPILSPNYPNPFNANTVISFELPNTLRRDMVVLDIYAINGQRVRSIMERPLDSGHHFAMWDGRDDNGKMVASGIYLAHLTWKSHHLIQKMLYVQ